MPAEGQAFLRECKEAGKAVAVWTVNDREEMIVSAGWGVDAVLTDKVSDFVSVRQEVGARGGLIRMPVRERTDRSDDLQLEENPSKLQLPITRRIVFPWTSWKYYTLAQVSSGMVASEATRY